MLRTVPEPKNPERHEALAEKFKHPERKVICPECGNEIVYHENGCNSCSECTTCHVTCGERGL